MPPTIATGNMDRANPTAVAFSRRPSLDHIFFGSISNKLLIFPCLAFVSSKLMRSLCWNFSVDLFTEDPTEDFKGFESCSEEVFDKEVSSSGSFSLYD